MTKPIDKNTKDDKVQDELLAKIERLTTALQIERADAINLRRRFEEEKASLGSFHKANVIKELLPVIDNIERSIKHTPEDLKGHDYTKGVAATAKQFDGVLTKMGVTKIKALGSQFDPNLHEAVSHNEDGDKEIVSEELQSGYKLGDQVIRHSVVKVN